MEQESKFPQLLSFIFLLGAMMVTPLLGQIAARGPAPEAPLQFVLQISTGLTTSYWLRAKGSPYLTAG